MKELRFAIEGMTCSSCWSRVKTQVDGQPGVHGSSWIGDSPVLVVECEDNADSAQIQQAVRDTGYSVREGRTAGFSGRRFLPLLAGLLIGALYLFADRHGVFSAVPEIRSGLGLGAFFLTGVLTSFHCIAMCGGLVLTRVTGFASGGRIKPLVLYTAGRVVSYTATGALAGAAGSAFGISQTVRVWVMLAAAFLMLLYGLSSLSLIPRSFVDRVNPLRLIPAGASRFRPSSGAGSLSIGLFNGLMPCGPLQAMQLVALGTGSAAGGASVMLSFALGTAPLLFGFGASLAVLPRRFLPAATKAGAVLILVFAFVTAERAFSLGGGFSSSAAAGQSPVQAQALSDQSTRPVQEGEWQTVITEVAPFSYPSFTVQPGIPVRWIIRVSEGNLNGCNNAIIIPAYNARIPLAVGDTVVEFTPQEEGTVRFSCWMGMIRSSFTVAAR